MFNLSCVICTESFTPTANVVVTVCGHMFHNQCLRRWLENSQTCPQCRKQCSHANIIKIYFNVSDVNTRSTSTTSRQRLFDNARHESVVSGLQQELARKDQELAKLRREIEPKERLNSDLIQEVERKNQELSILRRDLCKEIETKENIERRLLQVQSHEHFNRNRHARVTSCLPRSSCPHHAPEREGDFLHLFCTPMELLFQHNMREETFLRLSLNLNDNT